MLQAFLPLLLAAASQAEVQPALAAELDRAGPEELIQVIVVMEERFDYRALVEETRSLGRRERAPHVRNKLRPLAQASQAGLLAEIETLRNEGELTYHYMLWAVNAHRVTGTKEAVRRLVQVPGVDRVRWDPVLAPEETQDVAPPLPYSILQSERPLAEQLAGAIEDRSAEGGRVEVEGTGVRLSGAGAEAVLHADLSGSSEARLSWETEGRVDAGEGSGLFLSVDGVNFARVADLGGGSIDLVQTAAIHGWPLTADTHLSFRLGGQVAQGGASLRGVQLHSTVDGTAAEPNIVGLQAPDLWSIGVEGQGVLLLNIDSGVANNHPDLDHAIWSNPNETVNGLDDDGNGLVDDIWGWDFASNDNSPYGTGHGTNTAGIVVGDGTNNGGVRTGMAPGSTHAVTRISGEGDGLASYQYAIDIGVDAITSSHSWKWLSDPDYHLNRDMMVAELAAGIIHANSIGNQGNLTFSYPIPWNISAPANSPSPWVHPDQPLGEVASVMACSGILLGGDALYTSGGQGPSAWEDITNYDASFPHTQDTDYWDYPYQSGAMPGLMKPDVCAYTQVRSTSGSSSYTSSFGGTSAATPHLGGALCLLIDANEAAPPRQICQALQETAIDLGDPGKDTRHGAGKIQVYDAAKRILGLATASTDGVPLGGTYDLDLTGPAGSPYLLVFGFNPGSIPTSLGFSLEFGTPFFVVGTGVFAGPANPTVLQITVPDGPAFSGFTGYWHVVTDDTQGATGEWLLSVREPVTIR